MTGMDAERVREASKGWTLPARQLKLGEDPRDAARQLGNEVLGLKGLSYGEPRVEVEYWQLGDEADGPPERRQAMHFDVWFLIDAHADPAVPPGTPAWYDEVAWVDPSKLPGSAWARMHGDVVERWRVPRAARHSP
jgi:hypothetical protein